VGVTNGRERQIHGVRCEFLGTAVEHGEHADSCGDELVVASRERPQVQVAYGAAREPAQLEMDDPLRIGDGQALTPYANERARRDPIPRPMPTSQPVGPERPW
jgi:hypothetical protein